jgi:hypothetical protein
MVLASNDAVFEMGDLIRTLKRLLMESTADDTWFCSADDKATQT